jgi:outer membrane protein assembly factor BamB
VTSSPAVANGVVYAQSSYNFYALNAKTGARLWFYQHGNDGYPSPAVANGFVYVYSGGGSQKLYAFGLTP